MERVVILKDGISQDIFAMVSEKNRVLSFVGAPGAGREWAEMTMATTRGKGTLESVIQDLDFNFVVEGPKKMTRQIKLQLVEMASNVAQDIEEKLPEELKTGFTSDDVINNSNAAKWRAHLNYKALASRDDTYLYTLGYEFKVRKPIPFDLPNGGRGFRCPPGLGNGGAFTDRYGRNCGEATTRRLLNTIGNVAGKPKDRERDKPDARPVSVSTRASRRSGSGQVASRRGVGGNSREGD